MNKNVDLHTIEIAVAGNYGKVDCEDHLMLLYVKWYDKPHEAYLNSTLPTYFTLDLEP